MAKNENEIAAEALYAFKAIIRRAIMTLLTIRDPDKKYQREFHGSAWLFPVVNVAQEAYGYSNYGFDPTPHDLSQMEIVAKWLAWLRRMEGEGAIRRIISWTLGVTSWRIAMRERCSERTILNRIDRSIAAIIREFAAFDMSVEIVEDDTIATPYAMIFERPAGPHGGDVVLRKVYIYDKGFMVGSRKVRDGQWKAEKFMKAGI